jgi:hypothetical protein
MSALTRLPLGHAGEAGISALLRLPLACTGHVLIDLPIFMGPVVILLGWLLFVTRRERRREALAQQEAPV